MFCILFNDFAVIWSNNCDSHHYYTAMNPYYIVICQYMSHLPSKQSTTTRQVEPQNSNKSAPTFSQECADKKEGMRGSLARTRDLLHCGHCHASFSTSLEIPGYQTEVKAHRRLLWMLCEESMCLPKWLQLGPYQLLVHPFCLGELITLLHSGSCICVLQQTFRCSSPAVAQRWL